ncbi:MAG TPA: MFS transporter [Alteraurantiacibacter sp.]
MTEPQTAPTGAEQNTWPAPREAWWAVLIFGVTMTINQLDRGLVNLLVQPIKTDLGLSDTQISLVMGFAFVALYLLLGLPIARLVDGGHRRLILGTCVAVWSSCTALCGLAQNFWQLALFRAGVGAGEAGVAPSISSMMADLFPPDRLPRAMSTMAFAFVCGNGAALLLGGLIIGAFAKIGTVSVPLLGELRPWQMTLILVGLPGMLASLLYFTVPEPRRRVRIEDVGKQTPSLPEVLRYLGKNARVYAPMFIGLALGTMVLSGTAAWTPAFFQRTHGWSPTDYGVTAGIASLITSPIGLIAGIWWAERFIRKGRDDANLRLVAWSHWLALPFSLMMPLLPTPELAIAASVLAGAISVAAIGAQNAAILTVTPNRMRGQMVALFLLMFNVIGFGLGPTIVALLTDFAFGDEAMLRWALVTTVAVLGTLSAVSITLGLKAYGAEVKNARAW